MIKEQRVYGSKQYTNGSCLRCILSRKEISLGLSLSSINNLKILSPVICYSKPQKRFFRFYKHNYIEPNFFSGFSEGESCSYIIVTRDNKLQIGWIVQKKIKN